MAEANQDRKRCFLALPLSESLKAALGSHLAERRDLPPPYRPIPPENWHVTLHFLGDLTGSQRDALVGAIAEIEKPAPLESMVDRLTGFPDTRRARMLVAELRSDPLLGLLHEALAEAIRQAGLDLERRSWRPHITLARLRRGRMPCQLGANAVGEPLKVDSFELWASTLTDEGSQYRTLERWTLV